MLLNILLTLLMAGGIFFTLLGMFVIGMILRPARKPNDESNRINNISSFWIGLTKPEVLGTYWKMYQNDVLDNMKEIQKK